ncbi:MAG: Guanylate cyclase protein [Dehalococcoidia bacterium]|nr:Guanylate cyclase protein [Dehalococcoidia bacterium]
MVEVFNQAPPGVGTMEPPSAPTIEIIRAPQVEDSGAPQEAVAPSRSEILAEQLTRPKAPEAPSATVQASVLEPTIVPTQEDERKMVTILFGDVSGFTAMSEKLDSEDMKAIMDRCLKMLADQVDKYEGVVDKFEGDLIMATWGAHTVHEDDAERAVLAAVGMQEALTKFSADLERRRGFTLRMRIGVNTGEVIAGKVGAGREKDYTVMGDVVNTASRFESNATVGRVMVGQTTYDLTKHLVEYTTLEPITVKGKVEPLAVFEVEGVKTERGQRRGIAGLESAMVGRLDDVQKLIAAADEVHSEKRPHLVTILGMPGMGKSRLLGEFENHLVENQPTFQWAKGRSLPYGQGITYYPLGEIVKGAFGVKESDSLDVVREQLLRGVQDVLINSAAAEGLTDSQEAVEEEARQVAHRLAYAIGVSYPESTLANINPANLKDELFWAWRHFFRKWASLAPLVITFEDVHWADDVILDFIRHLVTTLTEDAPILIICISRPELLERVPDWEEITSHQSILHLTPLTPEEGVQFLDNLLSPNRLSKRFKEGIVQRAGGVPFFIEEILRIFLERKALVRGPGGWILSEIDEELKIPDTIQATVAARVDQLDLIEKTILQRASVVGIDFWESAIAYPSPALGQEASAMEDLSANELIKQKSGSSFEGDVEYAFHNTIIRDVTYNGMTRSRRSREHLRTGSWLELKVGDRLQEFIEMLAHHYGQAANVEMAALDSDYTSVTRAIHYLWEAGERARVRQSNQDALSRYNRALELIIDLQREEGAPKEMNGEPLELRELQVLLARAQSLEPLSRYDSALEDLEKVITGAETAGLLTLEASALYQKGKILRIKGELETAEENTRHAVEIYARAGDSAGQAQALLVLGEIFSDQAKLGEFEEMSLEAIELSRQAHSQWVEARGLTLLGTACVYLGKAEEARGYIEQAVNIYRGLGDRRGAATSLLMLGRADHMVGHLRVAATSIEEAIDIFEELGDRRAMTSASFNLGLMNLERGELDEARLYAERGITLTGGVGEAPIRIRCMLLLGQVEVESSNWDRAAEILKDSEGLCLAHNQKGALPEVYRVIGQAYLGSGDVAEAEKYALLGRDVVAEEDPYSQGTTRLVLALVLERQGRMDESEAEFKKAVESLEEAEEAFEIGWSHLCYGSS